MGKLPPPPVLQKHIPASHALELTKGTAALFEGAGWPALSFNTVHPSLLSGFQISIKISNLLMAWWGCCPLCISLFVIHTLSQHVEPDN